MCGYIYTVCVCSISNVAIIRTLLAFFFIFLRSFELFVKPVVIWKFLNRRPVFRLLTLFLCRFRNWLKFTNVYWWKSKTQCTTEVPRTSSRSSSFSKKGTPQVFHRKYERINKQTNKQISSEDTISRSTKPVTGTESKHFRIYT